MLNLGRVLVLNKVHFLLCPLHSQKNGLKIVALKHKPGIYFECQDLQTIFVIFQVEIYCQFQLVAPNYDKQLLMDIFQ